MGNFNTPLTESDRKSAIKGGEEEAKKKKEKKKTEKKGEHKKNKVFYPMEWVYFNCFFLIN